MTAYPLSIAGRTVGSRAALRDLLREDAHRGPFERRHEDVVEAWLEAMAASDATRDEVWELAIEMVADEDDPKVLGMLTALGSTDGRFATAAARRVLDGPALPVAPGRHGRTVEDDLRERANAVSDPTLRGRLAGSGSPLNTLELQIDARQPAMVDAFERAVTAGPVPVATLGLLAYVVASDLPDQLPRVARLVRGLSDSHKRKFLKEAADGAPDQQAAIEAILRGDAAE